MFTVFLAFSQQPQSFGPTLYKEKYAKHSKSDIQHFETSLTAVKKKQTLIVKSATFYFHKCTLNPYQVGGPVLGTSNIAQQSP